MPVIRMIRGDQFAYVETDHVPTYENFLAHGWKHEDEVEAPAPEPASLVEAPTVEADPTPAEKPAPAPKGRKAR